MKRLILVRHAKSSWDNPDQEDFDRPLNKRGRKDAPVMAAEMQRRIVAPDAILSSDSERTRETVGFILGAYGLDDSRVWFRPELYCAEVQMLLGIVSKVDDALSSVMLVGHNPGLTVFYNWLMPENRTDNLPTFGVVEMELEIEHWKQIVDVRNVRRTHLLSPKSLDTESL